MDSTTSLGGRMLGFALRAAGASEDTAPPDERAEAWANLQRLRHLLEGSQGGAEAVPADILVRTLELIGGFIHGTRKMNKDVDADAVRVAIMLFGIGGVAVLAERQCALLESYGAILSARAKARPHLPTEAMHWKTSAYLCDLCGMAVAVMAIEVVRLQQSGRGVLRQRVTPLGRMLHETMSNLSDRNKNSNIRARTIHDDTISVLAKVQAAYMRVLRPDAWYSRVGGTGHWVSLAMPVMLAAGVWYEGGWQEFRRKDNGVVTIIGVLLLICSMLPWAAPLLLKRDHGAAERAARVSGMLVEMAMFLRPVSANSEWGEYAFGGVEESVEFVSGKKENGDEKGMDGSFEEEEDDIRAMANVRASEDDARAMLASVRGLGDLALNSIKAAESGKPTDAPPAPTEGEILQEKDGGLSVQLPFPPELLDKMVNLEKMLRNNGGAPEEIAKAAERVRLLTNLLER